ncbi:PREDICTED: uncharacterized protein LOC109462698 [Branchiostoma belcheri]|uniref:Uncharacterized protein LOC109462698 n=1 Tax=Branchiostoma belcheri TaxID=7741 RepID=A0A6P4Y7R8_BRABE|nr:PREDICTED: uncharacterized protein LOC109462698 [Branchiostoma belcheri]
MALQILAAICVVPALFNVQAALAAPNVTAPAGRVAGLELDVLGTAVNAFLGIPFAKPPIGEQRFKRAEPKEPWDGTYQATSKPNACSQEVYEEEYFLWAMNTPVSEDCLYLNIWQPNPVPTAAAVMVWIYGGGFSAGSASLVSYDGRYLAATEGVIVVGINYRLSALGFLYDGTDQAPGNVGLTDQVLALQWIQDNIASFGGDPSKVTLFGESAGGISIGYHLISSGSWNLFSRAILQSGTALMEWGLDSRADAYDKAVSLAKAVECPTKQGEMLACLRNKDGQLLVNSSVSQLGYTAFYPIIDGTFIPESPPSALQTGAFKKADILLGSNENEGTYGFVYGQSPGFSEDTESLITKDQFREGIVYNVPVLNDFAADAAAFQYTDWEQLGKETMYRDALNSLYSDFYFICPDVNIARAHVRNGASAYMYRFAHRASISPFAPWMGAIHGEEIPFVFGLPLDPTYGFNEEEKALTRRMMRHWANFAKTGTPNNNTDGVWSAFNETAGGYMVLDTLDARMLTGPSTVNCAFWDNYVKPLRNKTEALMNNAGMSSPCEVTSGAPGNNHTGILATILAPCVLVILQLTTMNHYSSLLGMALQILAVICIVPALFNVQAVTAAPNVTAPTGRVAGLELDVLGTAVNAFLGIPFAKPPTGEQRFKRAEPKEPWDGTYQATRGSASLVSYDGRYLAATEGVIVMGINYRLSALGFLYDGTDQAPGNVGLTDQVLALQWIQDNIASFGGDPSKVTLFGESAGGISIGYHLIYPGSWNLFSRAILQSGTALMEWGLDTKADAYDKAVSLAKGLGCPTEQGEMLACLRNKDAQLLVNSSVSQLGYTAPILDGSFIPESPPSALETGTFKKADILLGSNEDEGTYGFVYGQSPGFSEDTESLITKEQFREGIVYNVPVLNDFAADAAAFQYTDWEQLGKETMYRDALNSLYSDFYFICPDVNIARAHVRNGASAYMYRFAHRASISPFAPWMGAIHGEEIPFVFGLPLDPTFGFNEEEKALTRRMMRHWANFAKTGTPNNNTGGVWSAFNESAGGYMVLDTLDARMLTGPSTVNCAFWDNYVKPLRNKTEALMNNAGMSSPCEVTSGAPGNHHTGILATILAPCALYLNLVDYSTPDQLAVYRTMPSPGMALQIVAAFCIVPSLFNVQAVTAAPNVTAPAGRVAGLELDVLGTAVNAFLGIPFAKPPIGEQRFKHAEPKEQWEGTYQATNKPNACSQEVYENDPNLWGMNTPVSEDCLYLNIWQPNPVPTAAAVMVWIYGGGFSRGSSSFPIHDGRYLVATEGVIVVGINYRLSALGFLYDGTDQAPGNVGLTDQVLALQWIQDNIASFGGDPSKVTLFGQSAGGISVGYHLLSHGSWNLFTRAILQSGTALMEWGQDSRADAYDKAVSLAKAFGCPTKQGEMLACLRNQDGQLLVNSSVSKLAFFPVLDGSFLPESPSVALETGAFKKADILLGSNENEGTYLVYEQSSDTEGIITKDQLRDGMVQNLPMLNEFAVDAAAFQYTDWEQLGKETMYRDALSSLYGDFLFLCPDVNTARAHVRNGASVYMYSFTHRSSISPYPLWLGSVHGEELRFVFGLPLDPAKGFNEEEKALTRRMMRHWANFAKTGNPNDNTDGIWSAFNETAGGYMVLDTLDARMLTGPSTVNCAFWDNYVKPLRNKTEALMNNAEMPSPCDVSSGVPGNNHTGILATILAVCILVILQLTTMTD